MPAYQRVLTTLCASLLVSAALAACGSPDDGSGPSGSDTGTGANGEAASATEFRDRDLLITAVCSAGANGGKLVSVDGWDPKTWKHQAKAEFAVPAAVIATEQQSEAAGPNTRSGLTALCTPDERGPLGRSTRDGEANAAAIRMIRSLFDRNFTKMAVVVLDPDSGASHVGYIDRGGQLTDLTASDTGFGSTPHEKYAVLAPDGTDVWFTYRTGGETKIGSRSVAGDHKLTERSAGVPDGRIPLFLVGSPVRGLVAYNVAVSPDGTRYSGWVPGNNDDDLFALPARTTALTETTPKVADNGCAGAVGWLNNDTLLCPTGIDDNLAPISVNATAKTPRHTILPSNNRDNTGMVISPDGARVVFLSAAGTEREYWISATQPGATPQRVEPTGEFSVLGDTAVFVEWR